MYRSREIRSLDPHRDHERIHRLSCRKEFPWDYGRGLELAVWRTCCVPSISAVLSVTGEFTGHSQKRYDDTRILLGEIVTHGYSSERGKQAIRQINRAHHRHDIDQEDMLYVLSTFLYEPIRWIERWAWRPLTDREKTASFLFYSALGRRLGVRAVPDTSEELEAFNRDYERRRFAYSPTNEQLGRSLLALYTSWYPAPLRAAAAPMLLSRLDDAALRALGLPRPRAWARHAQAGILRAHAAAERVAPRVMARLMTRPEARSYPGYPHGYELTEIGPASLRQAA